MIQIPDIEIVERIYQSHQTLVVLARRISTGQLLMIKYLNYDFPDPKSYYRFKNEYAITKKIDAPGIIKIYGLEKYRSSLAILMEYIGKRSLKDVIELQPLSWQEALAVAIQLTEAIQAIHEKRIIHKDINPANIIFEPSNGQLRIIDFGLSTELGHEKIVAHDAREIEGTLEYMSPEQTGRMNRSLDYRTDIYSLGATLYYMFSGQPPFLRDDSLELIHCHLAQKPISLRLLNDKIPQVLAEIVNRLLAKSPEDRYQSIDGLLVDLKKCQASANDGAMPDFSIGQSDISSRFNIPEKLYGRQKHVALLMEKYRSIALGTKELVLVAGTSGIGKTSVIQELKKQMFDSGGFFSEGKFDQFQRDIPYRGILLALNGVINQILTLPKEDTDRWRGIFLDRLQNNGKLITDVMPQLELIVGRQPELTDVGPIEEKNRFHYALETFFTTLTWGKRPLVLFLDDLQWADLPTLHLIEVIISNSDQNHLMIIGSYRDNEVDSSHPLMLCLKRIEAAQNNLTSVTLDALGLPDVVEIVKDTLFLSEQNSQILATILLNKTRGNPFFIVQLLKAFRDQGLIWFDASSLAWKYDANRMKVSDITENVVDLMVTKIRALPAETVRVLSAAACVGGQFNLDLLASISDRSVEELDQMLISTLQDDIVVPLNQQYRLLGGVEPRAITFRFLHDRVQQAAYSFCSSSDRARFHYAIGHWFWRAFTKSDSQNLLFQIVSHMDMASELVQTTEERERLSDVFFLAAKQAKKSAAYEATLDYLNKSLAYAGASSWQNRYALTRDVHIEKMEIHYTLGQYPAMWACIEQILQNVTEYSDLIPIYYTEPLAYIAESHPEKAIQSGLKGLSLLGLKFPKRKTIFHVLFELAKTRKLWKKGHIEGLLDSQILTDPSEIAKMKIMSTIKSACYFADSEQLLLNTCQQVRISIERGHTGISAIAYCTYGLVLCGVLYDLKAGSAFGNLSLSLIEKLKAQDCAVEVGYIYHNFIAHYSHHLSFSFDELQKVYQHGIETGNLEFAANSLMTRSYFAFFTGMELQQLDQLMAEYTQIITQRLNQGSTADFFSIMWQAIANLMGQASDPTQLIGAHMNETSDLKVFENKGLKTALLIAHMLKAHLNYLFGNIECAYEEITKAQKYQDFMLSHPNFIFMKFNLCMIELSRFDRVGFWQRRKIELIVQGNLLLFKKWASSCPQNYQHQFLLISGEWHRVKGHFDVALDHLQSAASHARKNGYLQFEALAHELLARIWLKKGNERAAEIFLKEAVHHYHLWGAKAKVDALVKAHPQLATPGDFQGEHQTHDRTLVQGSITSGQSFSFSEKLDIESVVKAIQVISSQMDLNSLLKEVMKITLEAAGADHGLLVVSDEQEKLHLKVRGSSDFGCEMVDGRLESKSDVAPLSIIQYCLRTQKIVNCENAHSSDYSHDSYIISHKTKSFLCIPVIDQGKAISVLFLENRLAAATFSKTRIKLLSILASQAAVSIKNAELLANMNHVNEMKSKLVDDLEMNDQYRMQFFNNISHELRTPLNGIIGFLELFQKGRYGELNPGAASQIGKIRFLADSLKNQVNTILDLAKSRTGSLKLVNSRFPLEDIFEEAKVLAESLQAGEVETEFLSQLGDQESALAMFGDREKIMTIIRNLLGNAFKFSRDAEKPRVGFQMSIDSHQNLLITVNDNGIGIAKEDHKTIFEQFKRIHQYGQRDYEGSGLGLAMVDQLVNLMGGSIAVESDLGLGAQFIVSIPQRDRPDLIIEVSDKVNVSPKMLLASSEALVHNHQDLSASESRGRGILIVDDNQLNCELIRDILQMQSYRTMTLTDSSKTMDCIAEFHPDLVILDLMMPKVSGEEVLQSIKAHPQYSNIPVILLTARASHEDRLHGLALGADDYMAKPILSDELVIRVENMLSRIELTRQAERRLIIESTVADAQKIHESLGIDASQIPGIEFTHYYQNAELTGGDWIGMECHPSTQRLYIMIADATGHGFEPAILTVAVAGAVKGALSIIKEKGDSISLEESIKLLHLATNEAVVETGKRIERQVTMAFCCLDLMSGEVLIINAGHRELLHCTVNGAKPILARGHILGYPSEDKIVTKTIQMVPGDSLFLFTDGLVENTGPTGHSIKMKNIQHCLEHGKSVSALKDSLLSYCQSIWQNQPPSDDCTFLLVRWLGQRAIEEVVNL